MPKLLLATTNQGKINEYRYLLRELPFELVTPVEEGINITVEERDVSLEDNAQRKAASYASLSGLITLADDSGLEVDALGGEPGVCSARYAGDDATDNDRIEYLLAKLKEVPREKRSARFKCVIAIAMPKRRIEMCYGECQGLIAFEASGDSGFGYDPVFYLSELDKTMAELQPEVKNQISHRARAAREACLVLEQFEKKAEL